MYNVTAVHCTVHTVCGGLDIVVTTSFDSCRINYLLVTSNLRSATVAFTTELDTLIPYLLLVCIAFDSFNACQTSSNDMACCVPALCRLYARLIRPFLDVSREGLPHKTIIKGAPARKPCC